MRARDLRLVPLAGSGRMMEVTGAGDELARLLAHPKERTWGMAMTSVRGIYEQAMGFYNVGDLDGLADAYTEDAVLVSPNGTVQGRTAIREHWSQEKAAFPDRTLTVNVVVEQGDTIAAEWTWAGTHTGPLSCRMVPSCLRPASGSRARAWTWRSCATGRQPCFTSTGTTWLGPGSSVLCRSVSDT